MFLFQKGKMQLKECLVTEPLVHRLQQSSVWWVIGGAALLRSRSSQRELYQMVNNLPFWELRLQLEALSTWSKLNWHRCSEAVVPLFYDALWVPKVIQYCEKKVLKFLMHVETYFDLEPLQKYIKYVNLQVSTESLRGWCFLFLS